MSKMVVIIVMERTMGYFLIYNASRVATAATTALKETKSWL